MATNKPSKHQKAEVSPRRYTHQSDEPKFIVTVALCMGGCPIATFGGLFPGMLVGAPHAQVTGQLLADCEPEGLSRLAVRPLHMPRSKGIGKTLLRSAASVHTPRRVSKSFDEVIYQRHSNATTEINASTNNHHAGLSCRAFQDQGRLTHITDRRFAKQSSCTEQLCAG